MAINPQEFVNVALGKSEDITNVWKYPLSCVLFHLVGVLGAFRPFVVPKTHFLGISNLDFGNVVINMSEKGSVNIKFRPSSNFGLYQISAITKFRRISNFCQDKVSAEN